MKTPKPYPAKEGWLRAELTLINPISEQQAKDFVTGGDSKSYDFGPTTMSPKKIKLIFRRKPDLGPPDPRPKTVTTQP
jgi:hypothetical protein